MVIILDYDTDSEPYLTYFNNAGINCKLSKREVDIVNSKAVVFPETFDISKSLRTLHLCNQFSVMRMIHKPILAVGSGVLFLGDTIGENHCGLGLINCGFLENSNGIKEISPVNVKFTSKNAISENLPENAYFNYQNSVRCDGNCESFAKFEDGSSAGFVRGMIWALLFNPFLSGETGTKLLDNFTGHYNLK